MHDKLLTIDDLANVLRLSRAQIYRLSSAKPTSLPPAVRLPGSRRLRWRRQDVDAWLANHVQVQRFERSRPGRPKKSESLRGHERP